MTAGPAGTTSDLDHGELREMVARMKWLERLCYHGFWVPDPQSGILRCTKCGAPRTKREGD